MASRSTARRRSAMPSRRRPRPWHTPSRPLAGDPRMGGRGRHLGSSIGLLVGAASIPVVGFVFAPAWKCAEASAATLRTGRRAARRHFCSHACDPVHLRLARPAVSSSLLIHRRRPRISYRGLRLPALSVFAARHLPLARATSLESWSDLSGAPTCAPDFLRARAMRVRMAPTLGGVTGPARLLVELRPTPA